MINKLVVKNYKKFDNFNITFNKDLNILIGDNESGKSTILECINLALNFKINGRFAQNELTSFLFNQKIVNEYITNIKTNTLYPLPEILIELYFEDIAELSRLKGSMNSLKDNVPGVKVIIKFNDEYLSEYTAFISGDKDKISTVPIEYYQVNWFSFADESITARSIPIFSTILDATNIRLQNGADSYIKSIIDDNLDGKQKAGLALAFRSLKEKFFQDPSIKSINSALAIRRGDITSKEFEVSLDVSQKNSWDSHLIPYLDKIPFHYSGMGEQSSLKLLLTLNKDGDESHVILIEEIENHLSFSTMAVLLKNIKSKCEGKQIFITTHSTYVLNKLGIDNLILLGQKNTVAKLSDLEKTTRDYFEKLPGYETLRMILSKKTILVEGPSDELIVQKAYIVKYGHLPIEDGIDVICIRGLSFKRFLDIALLLKLEISVVTDNDGDYALNINDKYKEYTSNDNIKIFASKNESLPTLEPQIVDCNDLEIIKLVLKKDFSNKEEAITYMTNKNNKTECALSIFNSVEQVVFPQYINDSITS